jgi:hypothetical protein
VNCSLTTCESQDSQRRSQLIRQWTVRFASNCGKVLSDDLIALWEDELSDLSPDVLNAAFRKTMQCCRFWPTVADIRSHVEAADSTLESAEADKAWDDALSYARRYGNVLTSSVPRIGDDASETAIRACGGINFIESCSTEQLVWVRKTFLENYGKQKSLPEAAQFSTRKVSPVLREAIDKLAERKALQ